MMSCKHAIKTTSTFATCDLNLYGGRPSHGTCARCDKCTDPDWHRQKAEANIAKFPQIHTPVTHNVLPVTSMPSVPRDKLPLAVKGIAMLAKPEDRGVGDIVERMAKIAGGKTLAQWYKELTGKDCGCANRKERLNRMYPLHQ